jgi:succinate dehydrogenase/fumarate reductase flavoprotein subunit
LENSRSVFAKWDAETDVVVVGYGGAGAAAAITASESGEQVLVIEKASQPGGSTRASTGAMRIPRDVKGAAQYIMAVGLGSVDEKIAQAFARKWVNLITWINRRGGRLAPSIPNRVPYQNLPGASSFDCLIYMESSNGYKYGCGKDLFSFLYSNTIRQKNVKVLLETRGEQLI